MDQAVGVGRDRGDDRDPAGLDEVLDRLGADLADLADQAEVDLLAVDDGVGLLGGEQPGVLAGEADREGPCWLIRPTSSRWTWPTSTIRTTSIASGVVTRSPPRNSDSMPSRSSMLEICGPPPCTTTGLKPA